MNNLSLSPQHLEDLRKSGLTDDTIKEADIKSVPPDQINKKLGSSRNGISSAYEIPYDSEYSKFKVFYEEGKEYKKDGDEKPKYLARKDSGNRLYIPSKVRPILNDVSTPLNIVEGEKKALKGCQEGCIFIRHKCHHAFDGNFKAEGLPCRGGGKPFRIGSHPETGGKRLEILFNIALID